MPSKDGFPTRKELAKWEREMKASGLWPEKIPLRVSKNPRVKARKAGVAMNTSAITRVSTEQGFETQNIVNDIRFYRARWM
jgi:hypothetical protein